MKILTLIFATFLAVSIAGCGGAASKPAENKPAENKAAENKPSGDQTNAPKSGETTTAVVTGVAACDEYLAMIEKFVNNPKVPQATRDMYKQTMEQNRSAWKQAASTPQGKAGLEASCKASMDAAKPVLEQYGK